MLLNELLKDLNIKEEKYDCIEINKIEYDSRLVTKGDVFVAVKGFTVDGHKYIDTAIENGATVIVGEDDLSLEGATYIRVENSRVALALLARTYYGNPQKRMKIIGITGTNGKTTTAFMMKSLFESKGYKCGLIGTVCNMIGDKKLKAERTTPESLELYKLFSEMVDEGIDYCIMEVSSHSLSLERVYGITFSTGVFTNLTIDHLDFHQTLENYFDAKKILFKNSRFKVVNGDNKEGLELKEIYEEALVYTIDGSGEVNAENINISSKGANFDVTFNNVKKNMNIALPGKYNVENALAVVGAAIHEGFSMDEIEAGMDIIKAVPGRCELSDTKGKVQFDIIIDYAHTPDGLENIIKTLKEITTNNLITVVGCGGDRDKSKRPIMGRIATELSDVAVITSDNPRSEDPMSIIDDVLQGISKENYEVVENRREAIKTAMKIAREGDVVLIAGKGHEDYQILKDEVIHFDEREIVAELLEELF